MNTANLITLGFIFTFLFLAIQRTERKRRLLAAAVMLGPLGWLIYRWAIFRQQTLETLAALGIATGVTALFWIVYGRRHPPGSGDDIHVVGMED